jgi:hypothetical protein
MIPFICGSDSGTGTIINYGSVPLRQKVTVLTIPVSQQRSKCKNLTMLYDTEKPLTGTTIKRILQLSTTSTIDKWKSR